MPVKFTTQGRIELWRGATKLSEHLSETAAVAASLADWEVTHAVSYSLKYPNKVLDLSELSRVIFQPDATKPNTPTGLIATPASETAANLSWSGSIDVDGPPSELVSGVAGYRVYRNGVLRTTVPGTTFQDTGLSPFTFYDWSVSAIDGANNESPQTAIVTARTLDTTGPTAPVIAASQTGQTSLSVALSTPSTDAGSGVATYALEFKRTSDPAWTVHAAALTAAQFPRAIGSLTAGTQYDTRCRATDNSSNVGNYSSTSQATTQSAGGGGLDLSWLPSPNTWGTVGLNTLQNVAAPYPGSGNVFIGNNTFLDQWCGAAFAPDLGALGSILYGPNGGHGTYDGSDVYRYDIATRQCSLLRDSYRPTTRPGNNSFGEWPDGSPHAPHDYQGHQCMPINGVWHLIIPQTYTDTDTSGSRSYSVHRLPVANPGAGWTRGPAFSNMLHPSSAYDANRRCIWYYPEATGPLQRFDGTSIASFAGTVAISQPTAAVVDTRRDQLLVFAFNLGSPIGLFVKNLQNPAGAFQTFTVGGTPGGSAAMEYVEELDRILAWNGSGTTVYQFDPGNLSGGWSVFSTGSGTPPPTPSTDGAPYSKIRYAPKIGSLLGITEKGTPARGFRIAGTTAPNSQLADWQARIGGPGVVWHHNFESAAEVNAFRWSPGFGGGNDPNDSAFPNRARWVSNDGFAGGGCLEMNRVAGSNDGCEFWRPFAPLSAPGNGKSQNDPAANGTLTVRNWSPTSGGSQTNTFTFGRYGNPAYVADGNFDGNEYYIQVRVKYDANRLAANNPGGGKMFYFTLCETSAPAQEIITESRDQTFNAAYLSCYRSVSPPLEGDTPGAGNQPGGALGLVDTRICSFDNTNGRAANCWQFPTGEWVTLLYHVIPGTDSGANTTFEIFACHAGEAQYRRIWRQTNVNLPYTSGRARCHSALIVSQYMNGQNFGTAFAHRFTQLIFSRNWIPPPKV